MNYDVQNDKQKKKNSPFVVSRYCECRNEIYASLELATWSWCGLHNFADLPVYTNVAWVELVTS